jgi:hypothetical protein
VAIVALEYVVPPDTVVCSVEVCVRIEPRDSRPEQEPEPAAAPGPAGAPAPALALKLAYVGTLGLFVLICAQFYLPGKGFTYLIMFGEKPSAPYVPALKAMNYYALPDSVGYDAQYYAQIAMRPWLTNRALNEAMDSMPYRARRILFSWSAYAFGWGDPARALHIYAVQNIVCWTIMNATEP